MTWETITLLQIGPRQLLIMSKQSHVCLKSEWTRIGLQPPDWFFDGGIFSRSVPKLLFQNYVLDRTPFMCSAQKMDFTRPTHLDVG